MAAGPKAAIRCGQGRTKVGLGRGRGSLGGELRCPTEGGPTDDDPQQERDRDLELSQTLVMDERAGNDVGQQPGLGDDQQGGEAPDDHGHHQIGPSRPGIVE